MTQRERDSYKTQLIGLKNNKGCTWCSGTGLAMIQPTILNLDEPNRDMFSRTITFSCSNCGLLMSFAKDVLDGK